LKAKFDQNKSVNPLNTVRAMFNALCDSFARDATPFQLSNVATSLECALGSQAALLAGILPSLTKLTNCSADGTSTECIDVVASMQFLFGKLLDILSHHKGVTFFLDDLQWADPTSLMLIRSMISNTKESGNVFFACCYRDDDMNEGDPFTEWLASINTFPSIRLQNISKEGVNELVSETLHLFPRITRPLASILHHKTRGNQLFLRQLLELLKDQGCIKFSVSLLRWTWDMEKIMNIDISDDVLALMMKEMQRLPSDVQFGLHVASCLGSSVKYSLCDILSQDLGVNLRSLLDQAVQTGFMVKVDETCIRFSHDKIQQAAYEMMPLQERLASHMRFGLAICSHSLDSEGNDDRFFAAINQINRGGADVLQDTNQKVMIAALNLKAGRRSMELSDFCTALQLFEHGMSFLDHSEHWVSHYSLSLDIFDGAVEVACHLNNTASVRKFSAEVFTHAKCDDDRLKCLYAVIKSLRVSFNLVEAKKAAFEMLNILGERVPRPSDDKRLAADLEAMKFVLDGTSDESILNSKEADQTWKDVLSLNLYHDLLFLFLYLEPMRIADISLRMVQITLSKGLCCMSPVAFAQFSVVLVTEDAELAYRVSKLALRLLDRADARRYTGAVIALVATGVSWVKEPLQSIPESHLVGYHHGQRGGDVWSSTVNYLLYLQIIYLSGQSLSHVRKKIWAFALELLQRKQQFMFYGMRVLYLQILALIEGLDFKEEEDAQHALPSWENSLKSGAGKNLDMLLVFSTHQLMRSFLFKQYDNLPEGGILNHITGSSVPLRPIFYYGILFEGLISFHLMRQTDREEYQKKGEAALVFMRKWSKCNKWNFECKYLLLEAEMMYSSGYHEQAEQLYRQSILSANEHKFVHIEAIACEAAATFYCHRGLQQKAHSFFARSVQCYKKWGALAVAGRVEKDMTKRFDTGLMQGGHLDGPSSSQKRVSKRSAN
jgi:predicted ATPase